MDWGVSEKTDNPSQRVNINDAITDIVRIAELDRRYEGIKLVCTLADDLPSVEMDLIRLQQIILNLARNGFD